jgi:glycosyltransferase involved in cell wall biosynthesis
MRVLACTRYTPLAPSSRIRFFQYFPFLRAHGVELQVDSLLGDDYVRRLYDQTRPSPLPVVRAYSRRIAKLARSHNFDLLWVEKELFPWLPLWLDDLLSGSRIPMVVDYDDAVFHRYSLHVNSMVRLILGRKIRKVMHRADTVVVGSEYLADYARWSGAGRIENLPSVVDLDRFSWQRKEQGEFRIGWIGSPITAPYLGLIREALEATFRQVSARLVLIGAGNQDPLPGMEKENLPWSVASEVADLQSLDVGIMPLVDGPFERGKCGYKIVQYMACGLPVIASPVGGNQRILEEGRVGFLASDNAEWEQALVSLAKDPELRHRLGQLGRERVEQEYNLQVTAPQLLEILSAAASRRHSP